MTYAGDVFDFGSVVSEGSQDPGGHGGSGRGAPVRWGYSGPGSNVEPTPCPVCGASGTDGTITYRNTDGPEAVEGGHGGVWQRATCGDCDASWAECYYLLGALVDLGPEVEPGYLTRGLAGISQSGEWTPFYRVADGSLLDVAIGTIRAWDAYRGNPSVDIDGAIDALRALVELFGDGPGMVKVRGVDVER